MQARPGDYQQRVATLLGAPMRDDPGMPTSLALDTSSSDQQLAAEATAMPEAPRVAAVGELPAVGGTAQPQPVAAPVLETVAESAPRVAAAPAMPTPIDLPAQKGSFDVAFTAPPARAAAQEGWVQPAPAAPRAAAAARPAKPQRTVRVVLPAPKMVVQRTGSHLVQLGSFASPQGARRGWGILAARNGELRNYRMVITPVVVRGKNFWRVAAAGFDATSAGGLCSSLKNRGGVCFAYAANRAPASDKASPFRSAAGPQKARRR